MTRAILFIALATLGVMAFSAERQLVPSTVEVPALVYWASLGRTETVRQLLVAKGNPNAVDTGGWSALQAAAENGHLEIVKLLVAAGANVNYASEHGTALQFAVRAKQDAVASFLRSVGAK